MAVDAALTDPARTDPARTGPVRTGAGPDRGRPSWARRVQTYLPQGNLLDDEVWQKRHDLLRLLLLLHLPVLTLYGLFMHHTVVMVLTTVAPFPVFWVLGDLPYGRRVKSFFVTAGIVYGAAALVVFSNGAIEAHFDFFIVIGFIALYQDWVPFGWDVAFTVLSHGLGSAFKPDMMFNTMAGMDHPWRLSFIHGFAVLLACIGMVLFWRTNEDEQQKTLALTAELSAAELARRKFTSDLLVNLARRNQSMLYRQLDIINQLEEKEQDPDALFELFRLDHLATRIRRNAENLLVLSGAEPPRVWGKPVPLTDVVRAAIAETEDLSRVTFSIDERLTLVGQAVIDVTHLLAELIENAVRFSPPESRVTVRSAPDVRSPGSIMVTVEDWGVGMPTADLAEANLVLAEPREVDALVSSRLGLHVISRLAGRYSIRVVLAATAGSGITAVLLFPPDLFTLAGPTPSGPLPTRTAGLPAGIEPRPAPGRRRAPAPLPPPVVPPVPGLERSASPSGPIARPTAEPTPFPPPAPVPARSPTTASIQVDRLSSAPSWDGWWEPDAEAEAPPGSSPSNHPLNQPPNQPSPAAVGGAVQLTRRTPQAHLAPELQRDRSGRPTGSTAGRPAPGGPSSTPGPDAARARQALSRYQASRQAALADQGSAERNQP